jgi:signal transduction histidine kinase
MNDNERPAIDLGEFLTVLSHQLRNPVQAISSNAWLLKSRGNDEKVLRPAEAIERQVARLSKVLDDVSDMVRVTRNAELETANVSLQQIVAAAVATVKEATDLQRREIDVDMPEQAIIVNADARRLAQAIGNVLHNAVKFSPQQGRIDVRVKRSGDTATISVKDQGIGIAHEDMARVFEPFAHGKSRSHHSEVELGIGLHIARQLMRAHGGGIEAYSDGPGKGAEFLIRIPVAAHASGASPSREAEMRDRTAFASSSWTTIATRRTASPKCSRCTATIRVRPTAARKPSSSAPPRNSTWPWWTSACPMSTAWKSRGRSRAHPSGATRCWWR